MKKRVADIIVETLVERGITDCFAVVGGGAMYLDNALGINNDINVIFNHHEQACSMAADAYSRLTGKMAAVCVTSGPGATNVITGVMGAWQDSLPMIVISGQVREAISIEQSGLPLRYRGVQEFEIIPCVKNMTKYAVKIKNKLSICRELNKAIDIAMSGRRGPVWLDIPQDIQSATVEVEELEKNEDFSYEPKISKEQLDIIISHLSSAKRPVILAGNGIVNSGCLEQFYKFVDNFKIPVVAANLASDVLYKEHERFYGLSGIIGLRAGNFILQNADVILVIGCSLGFQVTGFAQEEFAPNAFIMSIDADEYEMKKPGLHVDLFVHSTAKAFFQSVEENGNIIESPEAWINYCDELLQRFCPYEAGLNLPQDERVCSYWFWHEFDRLAPKDCICALGNNTGNTAKLQIGVQYSEQRLIGNRNCGSMGFDLPAAIGACVASNKDIICVTGDGSIMMNLQELQTIKYNNLPVKIIVFSNDGYNAIRQTSLNFFDGFFVGCNKESGVSFPSFEKIAHTFDFKYRCCSNNGEVADSLHWLFKSEAPVLLEVMQRLDDPVTPKVMSRKQPDGTLSTPALHDMYPFLSKEEMEYWMSISK